MESTFRILWQYKIQFLVTYFVVFTVLYGVLFVLDFLPEAPEATLAAAPVTSTTPAVITEEVAPEPSEMIEPVFTEEEPVVLQTTPDQPTSIYIERLDKTIDVLNPQSRTIAELDNALLSGVVRHPDSVTPNVNGNVFILGHSSYLPSVLNKNFQAFNGIQNLEWGDTITLTSENAVYTYRVERVYKAKASEVTVPVKDNEKRLTIATCNSFGSTDDRYIVEAKQINAEAIG